VAQESMSKTLKKIEERNEKFKRSCLTELLAQHTDKQRDFFMRLYGDVENIETCNITEAILLCERTIKKNKETSH
jgi:hypothetical protein